MACDWPDALVRARRAAVTGRGAREAAEEQRRLLEEMRCSLRVRAAIRARRRPQQVNRPLAIERAAWCTERGREALQLLRV